MHDLQYLYVVTGIFWIGAERNVEVSDIGR